jgi:hypothetical protein
MEAARAVAKEVEALEADETARQTAKKPKAPAPPPAISDKSAPPARSDKAAPPAKSGATD